MFEDFRDDPADIRWQELLRQEGSKAATYILASIKENLGARQESFDSDRLYIQVNWLQHCATSREASKIGELLTHDGVSLDFDRSIKTVVLEILERVGTSDNISHIVSFCDKAVTQKPYVGPRAPLLIGYDLDTVLRTLLAIAARADHGADQEGHQAMRHATNRIRADLDYLFATPEYRAARQLEEIECASLPGEDLFGNDDSELSDAYMEGRYHEIESRLVVLRNLRHAINRKRSIREEPEDDIEPFLRRHYLEYREEYPPPYAPTMGIEIEIRNRAALPKEAENWSDEDKTGYLAQMRAKYKVATELGVPQSPEIAFWEFAHRPSRYYLTLSREVQALIEMGLIRKDYRKHSLHLTMGGIDRTPDALVLARALEGSGWSTSKWRLLRPYISRHRSWITGDYSGVKPRFAQVLKLGISTGIEIRTFQLQSLSGLDRMLRSAFLLGAALKSFQEEKLAEGLSKAMDAETKKRLAVVWEKFAKNCKYLFQEFGLKDPAEEWEEPDPHDKERKSDFVPLANLLDEARKNPNSRGAEFVAKMCRLIMSSHH